MVQVWLATRLSFAILAVVLAISGERTLSSVLAQWDVEHYLGIAREGYADPQRMAFFPGWPLVLGLFESAGLPTVVLGSLVASVCALLAALALQRLGGRFAAVAWLLAPTAIFTAVPYTEGAFCAAAFWAWERAKSDRWGQAALLASVACTLRVSGLFLIGALLILAITQQQTRTGDPRMTRLAWLLLPTAVLGIYLAYLYGLTGSWTAWYSAQQAGWQRDFHWPWQAIANHIAQLNPNPEHPEWVWIFRGELISWIVGLVVIVVALLRKQIAEASWVGVQVLALSLSQWLMSVNRSVLLWFPLWQQIGEYVESRPRTHGWITAGVVTGVLAFVLQMVWAWLYFTGRWAS
ncbi:MAG: mannosyltransferase family protein [Propioniciclava sp.]